MRELEYLITRSVHKALARFAERPPVLSLGEADLGLVADSRDLGDAGEGSDYRDDLDGSLRQAAGMALDLGGSAAGAEQEPQESQPPQPPQEAQEAHEQELLLSPPVQHELDLTTGNSLREAVDAYERQLIGSCLARHGGNVASASRELGLDRANLNRLARRLGLK